MKGRFVLELFGHEIASFEGELTPPEPIPASEERADDGEKAADCKPADRDPSTYRAEASTARPARTEFAADPDPLDRFGFGFGVAPRADSARAH